ncbi:MAG: MFS transporter [Anaerolineaceae bacterium]|nr:MFS transporter [Anaerolineaceae bacterium]
MSGFTAAGKRAQTARRIRIVLAFFSFAAGGITGGAIGVAWLAIRDTWNLPTAYLGILLLAMTSGFLSGSFVSGFFVTRLGMGNTLFACSAATTLGLLGFALAPGWVPLIVIVALSGTGKGIFGASMNLYFANHFNARLMNWLHACFALGATLGPFAVQLTSSAGYDWRSTWFVLALIQVLVSGAFYLTRSGWHTSARAGALAEPGSPSMLETLRKPTVLLAMLLLFIFTGIESSAGNWSFTLFSEFRAIEKGTAATWLGLYWASFALGRILYGFVATRLQAESSVRILFLLVLLGGLMFTVRDSRTISLAGLMLVGLAQAPVTPLFYSMTPGRMGERHATNAIGFQMSATGLGFSVLPALLGAVADVSSYEILGPFLALSALLSLLLFNRIARGESLQHG